MAVNGFCIFQTFSIYSRKINYAWSSARRVRRLAVKRNLWTSHCSVFKCRSTECIKKQNIKQQQQLRDERRRKIEQNHPPVRLFSSEPIWRIPTVQPLNLWVAVAAAVATNALGGERAASERRVSATRSNTPTRMAESHCGRSSTSLWEARAHSDLWVWDGGGGGVGGL